MAEAVQEATETEAEAETFVVQFTIPKCGSHVFSVDLSQAPRANYAATLIKGLQALCGTGLTKVLTKGLEGQELEEARLAAIRVVEENVEKFMTTELSVRGIKRSKTTGKEKTRAKQKAIRIV